MAQCPSNYYYNGSWDGEQPYDTAFEVGDIIECTYSGYDRIYAGDVFRVQETKKGSYGQIIRITSAPGYSASPTSAHFFKSKNFKLILQKGPAKMAVIDNLITPDTRILIVNENGQVVEGVGIADQTTGGAEARAREIVEELVQKSPTKTFRIFELTQTASAPKIPVEWKTA